MKKTNVIKTTMKSLVVLALSVMLLASSSLTAYAASIKTTPYDTTTDSRRTVTVTYTRSEFKALKGSKAPLTVKFKDGEKATVNIKYCASKVEVSIPKMDYKTITTSNWTVKCNSGSTLTPTGKRTADVSVGSSGSVKLTFVFNHPID